MDSQSEDDQLFLNSYEKHKIISGHSEKLAVANLLIAYAMLHERNMAMIYLCAANVQCVAALTVG